MLSTRRALAKLPDAPADMMVTDWIRLAEIRCTTVAYAQSLALFMPAMLLPFGWVGKGRYLGFRGVLIVIRILPDRGWCRPKRNTRQARLQELAFDRLVLTANCPRLGTQSVCWPEPAADLTTTRLAERTLT